MNIFLSFSNFCESQLFNEAYSQNEHLLDPGSASCTLLLPDLHKRLSTPEGVYREIL